MIKATAYEAGRLTTVDVDGTKTEYPFALLIACRSADDLREALKAGEVQFTFGPDREDGE